MDMENPRLKILLVILLIILLIVIAVVFIMINNRNKVALPTESITGNKQVKEKTYTPEEINSALENQPESAESPETQKVYTPEEIQAAINAQK